MDTLLYLLGEQNRSMPPYDDEQADVWSEMDETELFYEYGIRTRHLESLAKDIERFYPDDQKSNIDDYLRELERFVLIFAMH